MKNKDLFVLSAALESVANLPGVKFAYAVAKNLDRIRRELKVLQEVMRPFPNFLEFDKKRIELCKKHAKKDDKGEFCVENDHFQLKDSKKFEIAFKKLKKEHKNAINDREKQEKEYESLTNEECSIDFSMTSESSLPEGITAAQILSIMPIIKDDTEEKSQILKVAE